MDFITIFGPYIAAAFLGLAYAWGKYRADILDPTKPTPENFDWEKGLTTTLIAVCICLVSTAVGKTLDINGLELQMGAISGIVTPYVQPIIKAVLRRIKEQIAYGV